MKNFLTVADHNIYRAEYEINKSKFFIQVCHIETEIAAKFFLQNVRKKYYDATHNCSAWIIGELNDKQKSSDDGEPSGTAGKPILEVIKKNGLTNTMIVVTRYFGGTKLGAGGLIRAYSHAASLGLSNSKVVCVTLLKKISLVVEYNYLSSIEKLLREKKIIISNKYYSEIVTFEVLIPPQQFEFFLIELNEITNTNFLLEEHGEVFIPIEV